MYGNGSGSDNDGDGGIDFAVIAYNGKMKCVFNDQSVKKKRIGR